MSFTLNYTGDEINAILARANNGGEIDDELALKAPLASPALTGNPTAPTQPEEDNSTKIATTEYADRAADAAGAAAEAAAKEYTDEATSALYITDTASGSIANFSDGADGIPMRSVKAQIEPVQDLHGQDAPYPPGGGKNKAKTTLTSQTQNGLTFTVNTDGSISVSGTATAMTTLTIVSNLSLTAGEWTLSGAITNASIFVRANADMGITGNQADTGSGKTFTVTAAGTTTVAVQVGNGNTVNGTIKPQVESGSTATSYAPYSNECPISGWTGAEVTRTGVNVWDEETELGGFDADGNKTNVTNQLRTKNPIMVIPGKSYYASHATRYRFYDRNDVQFSSTLISAGGEITVPEGTAYMLFGLGLGYGTTYNRDISINYPSSDHDYHAYAGETYPISWQTQAGEVFGGTIDLVSGELKVTHKAVDMGTLTWTYEASPNRFKSESLAGEIKPPTAATVVVNAISSLYKPVPSSSLSDGSFASGITGNVFVKDTRYTVAADFKAAVAGQTIVYELAQPVIYRLSAQQITSLLGQNNVWSNTGDVEVEYVADPKLYIAKMLGGGALTLGSVSPLSLNRPVAISEEDLEQAGEASKAVEVAAETMPPAESGETEEGAQE